MTADQAQALLKHLLLPTAGEYTGTAQDRPRTLLWASQAVSGSTQVVLR